MHEDRRAHHLAAVDLADGLVAEADAEDGDVRAGRLDQLQADAGLVGRAGAGREHDALGLHLHDIGNGDLVVAEHLAGGTELAQEVDEVIGEAVVVIDQDEHGSGLGEGCGQGQGVQGLVAGLGWDQSSQGLGCREQLEPAARRAQSSATVAGLEADDGQARRGKLGRQSACSSAGSPSPASSRASPCMPGSWPTIMTWRTLASTLRRRASMADGAAR